MAIDFHWAIELARADKATQSISASPSMHFICSLHLLITYSTIFTPSIVIQNTK